MPRKGHVPKRQVIPDPVYNSPLVSKFINCIMWKGKKSTAEQVFYGALDIIKDKTGDDPLKVFKKAVDNVKPVLEVKSRRVGGANYQVPIEVNQYRRVSLSIRWLITFTRMRKEKSMQERLAAEFMDAAGNRGAAVKRREDVHRMAEANKAFAHYRW